jgi:hypothetical protein
VAQVTRTASKAKFQNGDIPTENDFIDLHDSVTWYDETGSSAPPNVSLFQALGSTIKAEPYYSVDTINTTMNLNWQDLRFVPVYLSSAQTITGVIWYQHVQGVYTADNYNGVGLYSISGGTLTLRASSTNDGDIWKATSATWASKAFSSTYAAAAGVYYIAFNYNRSAQTTGPSIGAMGSFIANGFNGMNFTNSAKLQAVIWSQTSLPGTVATSSFLNVTSQPYVALY